MSEFSRSENGESVKTESELRAESSQKLVDFLEKSKVHAYMHELINDREDIPSFDEFKDFLIRLNGIVRKIPISERTTDGENVQLSGFIEDISVPRHSDKEQLLKYAYESLPNIKKEDVRYMLPAVINAVHLFADGNGRTSRIVHQLFSDYKSEGEFLAETQKALEEDGRYETLDINPGLITLETERIVLKNNGWTFSGDGFSDGKLFSKRTRLASAEIDDILKDNIEIPAPAEDFLRFQDNDGIYVLTSIYSLFGNDGVSKFLINEHDKASVMNFISPRKMVELLTEEEWQKLVDIFYKLKSEEVRALIDIFKDPIKYKTKVNGEEVAIKDVLIKNILQNKG